MSFSNKVAIITGGTTGIGAATRKLLTQRDCKVYSLDIDPFDPDNENEFFIRCDVRNYDEIRESISYILIKQPQIDFVFANAGIYLYASVEETSTQQLENIISTNLKGTFYLLKEVLPIMKRQKFGSIVLSGSDQTLVGKEKSAAYGLTKGAIGQLTKSTAIDYAEFGIRVNCVCPGTIETPLYYNGVRYHSDISGIPKEDIYESLKRAQPMQRIGKPEEVAKTVVFLLSDDSSFITGTLVSVDGGYVSQ